MTFGCGLPNLQIQHNEVVEDLEHEQREVTRLEGELSALAEELGIMRSAASHKQVKYAHLLIVDDERKQRILELKAKLLELETDRDLKAPLIKVAADIRLRYLENAREVAKGISRAQVDRAIIMDGNNAAHRANGVVNAVMFKCGLVPEGYLEDAVHVFEKPHEVLPENYGCWSPRILRLMDCRATLKSLKPAAGIKSHPERTLHTELDTILLGRRKEMLEEAFEADSNTNDLLLQLEELTDEIVETDRSKYPRQRRYISEAYGDIVEEENTWKPSTTMSDGWGEPATTVWDEPTTLSRSELTG